MTIPSFWQDPDHGGFNGWIDAGLFVIAVSLLNIVYAYASQHGVHPMVFVLYATAGAAAAMLCVTGLGDNPREVLLAPMSWIYGCATIAMEAFYFLLVSVVPPAEASLMTRLAIPASLLFGWLAIGRSFGHWTLIGALTVIAAILPLFWLLEENARLYAFLFAAACAIVVSVKSFSSEFHPENQKAKTVKGKLQVTGLVVLTTALIGIGLMTVVVLLKRNNAQIPSAIAANGSRPHAHPNTYHSLSLRHTRPAGDELSNVLLGHQDYDRKLPCNKCIHARGGAHFSGDRRGSRNHRRSRISLRTAGLHCLRHRRRDDDHSR